MGCRINNSNPPPVLWKFSTQRQKPITKTISFSSPSNSQNQQELAPITAATQTQHPKSKLYTVKFRTLSACKLGISIYPDFEYNAEGGKGTGSGAKVAESNLSDEVSVSFDLETLYIPPLKSVTTKFLGLPLPPFLKIDIVPELFSGSINQESGQVKKQTKTSSTKTIVASFKFSYIFHDQLFGIWYCCVCRLILNSRQSSGFL